MRRLLAALAVALFATSAQAGWWDDAGAAKPAALNDLRRDPGAWRDVVVAFDVRVAAVVEPGDPGFTRFAFCEWRALAVSAADAAPESGAAKSVFSLVFVRRGSEAERRVVGVAKPARVQIRGVVRDVVRGEPWIEVLEATGDADPLTPEEANVVARADEFLARANPAAAEALYRGLVATRSLPKLVRAELLRKIGASCRAQRRLDAAVEAYAAALAADPDDGTTARQLDAARAAVASAPRAAGPVESAAREPRSATSTAMLDEPPPPAPPKPNLAGPK
jgi:tetratricopeptide (TPR) repeat protein